jgi:hypothetical protein
MAEPPSGATAANPLDDVPESDVPESDDELVPDEFELAEPFVPLVPFEDACDTVWVATVWACASAR